MFGLPKLDTRRPAPARAASLVAAEGAWYSRAEPIMGTAIRVELWSAQHALAEAAMADVMAEMHRIDRRMSPYHPYSELSRINRDAAFTPVALSEEMAALIGCAIEFSALSDGAFDISYAAVGQLYDYRRALKPGPVALAEARAAVGWQHLLLDRRAGTLRFARHGMRIDLGGFAKGHAVDRCIALLRGRGIQHAMVSAGGDSHVLGDRRGRPWSMAIRDPRREGGVVALLPLQDTAVSTSGDYERYFEADGERHHHILDPRTGRSPASLRSVTILADDGLSAEALSKTVFVLGLERGMALVDARPGVDAVVVDADGRLHCSSGLENRPAADARTRA